MTRLLNKSRFIWDYTKHEIPNVEVKNCGDKVKAARQGRLYILERLKMDNLVLPIKTKETTVNEALAGNNVLMTGRILNKRELGMVED